MATDRAYVLSAHYIIKAILSSFIELSIEHP